LEELVGTEIRVMRAISERGNENVVRFIDRFMSDKSLFIVMEYCNGGDL
jgi:serine/threonine protein kinase